MDFEHLSEAEGQAQMNAAAGNGGSAGDEATPAWEPSGGGSRWSQTEWEEWNRSRWWAWSTSRYGNYWGDSSQAASAAGVPGEQQPASSGAEGGSGSVRNELSADPWRAYSAGQSGWDRAWGRGRTLLGDLLLLPEETFQIPLSGGVGRTSGCGRKQWADGILRPTFPGGVVLRRF